MAMPPRAKIPTKVLRVHEGRKVVQCAFGTRCPKCPSRIVIGDEMIWSKDCDAYVHFRCEVPHAGKRAPAADWPSTGDHDDMDFDLGDDVPVEKMEAKLPTYGDVVKAVGECVRGTIPGVAGAAGEMIKKQLAEPLTALVNDRIADSVAAVRAEYEARIAAAYESMDGFIKTGIIRTVHTIQMPDKTVVLGDSDKVYHEEFPWILRVCAARKPVFLPGPTGCGKSHIGEQIADVLGLPFGFISCSPGMTESTLLGRSIPNISTGGSVYQGTQFVDIYENGGVFLFDEIDAADPTVLLVLNAALANGILSIPNRPEKPVARRHKDFVCIAGANTLGTGADRQYVGRNQIDLATLDRFRVGMVMIDYSPVVETRLCPTAVIRELFWGWRAKIRENRLERVLSTRFMRDAHDMIEAGATLEQIAKAFFCGWPAAERSKVDCLPYPKLTPGVASPGPAKPGKQEAVKDGGGPAFSHDDEFGEVPF